MSELVSKLKGRKLSQKSTASKEHDGAVGNHSEDGEDGGGENGHSGEVDAETGNDEDDGFGLTDGEALQVLNLMPRETVEIHLMIEDLPSRMTEERQGELLELVGKYSTTYDASGVEEAGEEAEDVEENGGYYEGEEIAEAEAAHADHDNKENGYR
uniref:DNA-directed RNA polymerase III subunit RPC9 n=1 Tax=Trieres chinensis TaxID=1514140 RepID=A0A7S2EJ46_TRICV|mmetsp:Transcript_26521/g.54298  ORF Transcript_26521/g.54298 Transcript_26521/m.54298 type:complete len:156 (+) Transcript_26521:330-797(+)